MSTIFLGCVFVHLNICILVVEATPPTLRFSMTSLGTPIMWPTMYKPKLAPYKNW